MGLTELQRAALVALADACNWSLGAHPPEEAVTRRVKSNLRGDIKKGLDQLRRMGYCVKHPTGRNMTWQLTPPGLQTARALAGFQGP